MTERKRKGEPGRSCDGKRNRIEKLRDGLARNRVHRQGTARSEEKRNCMKSEECVEKELQRW